MTPDINTKIHSQRGKHIGMGMNRLVGELAPSIINSLFPFNLQKIIRKTPISQNKLNKALKGNRIFIACMIIG